jgi:ABC-type siderophore export system fused ATPase/permease subunit
VYRNYSAQLVEPMNFGTKKGFVSRLRYGLTQITLFFILGLIIYLGIVFMVHLEMADAFTAIYAILFSGMTENIVHYLPGVDSAKVAAASIFVILDRKDEDQNVEFKYASRDQAVFKELNLEIKRG